MHLQNLHHHFIYRHILSHHQSQALFRLIQKMKKVFVHWNIFPRSTWILNILFRRNNTVHPAIQRSSPHLSLPGYQAVQNPLHPLLIPLSRKIIQKIFHLAVIIGIHHCNMRIPSGASFFRQVHHVLDKRGSSALVRIRFVRWNFWISGRFPRLSTMLRSISSGEITSSESLEKITGLCSLHVSRTDNFSRDRRCASSTRMLL